MKNLLFIFSLAFLAQMAKAQIQLEHTYTKGVLSRVRLDLSGERYVLNTIFDVNGVVFHIFDSLHTNLDKSIIAIEPGSYLYLTHPSGFFLSEHILDQDSDIELAYAWGYDGEDVFGTSVVQETGEQDDLPCMGFSIIEGLSPKLICYSKVYELPAVELEHDYGDLDMVQRMVFPIGGERFIASIWDSDDFDGFHVYDSNHNLLTNFNFSFANFQDFRNFTQTVFNDDALLEVYGTKKAPSSDANGNDNLFQIVQQDGTVLFSEQCLTGSVSSPPNLPTRIIIHKYSTPGQLITLVLDAKTFEVIHNLPGRVIRFSPDGMKDYYRSSEIVNNTLTVYDGVTLSSKVIDLGSPTPSISMLQFSRNRIKQNGKLELFFKAGNGIKWIDEDSELLHTFEKAFIATIDRQSGMEDKLFIRYPDSTQVYDFLASSTPVDDILKNSTLEAFPSPFAQSFEVKFPYLGNYSIYISDMLGRCILTQNIINQEKITLTVPANCLDGLYFLTVKGDGLQSCLKLVKGK